MFCGGGVRVGVTKGGKGREGGQVFSRQSPASHNSTVATFNSSLESFHLILIEVTNSINEGEIEL